MILSHRHKFIFLKTNKTAGTSMEIALSKFCGKDDIITPISPEDERTRRDLGYPGPQNWSLDRLRSLPGGTGNDVLEYYNHVPARFVLAIEGEETWKSYFKFCFERNPWDKAVSLYTWRCRQVPEFPFEKFIKLDVIKALRVKGLGLYSIDGQIAVDRVYLYEKLAKSVVEIQEKLALPEKLVLPRTKVGMRKGKRHYSEYYDDASRKRIAEAFKLEIALFGYEFQEKNAGGVEYGNA